MRFNGLKTLAFASLLVMVGARCLMREVLREPPVVVGTQAAPRDAMATVRLILDALICIPALLVTLHRALNPTSRIKLPGFTVVFALLAGWAMMSASWSADRYAALATGIDALAAVAVLYAGIQCIDCAKRTRWVAALVVGLLVALLGQGIYHRTQEYPAMIQQWNDKDSPNSRWAYMKNNNLKEGDFQFKQFEVRIKSGEVMGYSLSPNGYAAIVAVGLVVLMGVMADHWRSGRAKLALGGLIILPAAVFVLRYTYSKQGMITPILGLLGLMASGWLARRYRKAFWVGLSGFLALVGLGIAIGVSRGGFPDASLTVRWYYAVGGWEIFKEHLWTGVGWSNFGVYYPAVRHWMATEQVQDPHNILVRGLTELGVLGVLLMGVGFAWGAWEVFKPHPEKKEQGVGNNWPRPAVMGVAAGMILTFLASEDFSMGGLWVGLSAIGTIGLGLGVLTGMMFVMEKGGEERTPWIKRGLAAGLAVYFLHNLLDFSWTEPGQLCLAALLAASVVGTQDKQVEQAQESRTLAWGALGGMLLAWGALWILTLTVAAAEMKSVEADVKLRGGYALSAAERYAKAFEIMPINGDYAFKEGLAWQIAGQNAKAKAAYSKAIGAHGRLVKYYVSRGAAAKAMDDKPAAVADYAKAASLDSMDLDLGLEYAKTLEWAGQLEEAKKQYLRVLEIDKKLKGEVRRLSDVDRNLAMEKSKL